MPIDPDLMKTMPGNHAGIMDFLARNDLLPLTVPADMGGRGAPLLNAMIRDNLVPATPFAVAARINRLKIEGSDTACHIALGCLTLIGPRGYAEGGPYSLSEVVRDVLSGPLMVANARLQANTAGIDRYSEERP